MSQGSPARTVGARLREAREKRGVSLGQIAARTRISIMSLEALERSDLSKLPGGIFTRSFVRAYAQEVGLDPDRTIQDFIAELPPDAARTTAHNPQVEDGEKLESDRRAVSTVFRLFLISAPIIGLVLYYGGRQIMAPAEPEAPAVTDGEPAHGETDPAPGFRPVEAPVADSAHSAAPVISTLEMQIAPKAACWVSVTVDGDPAFSGLMQAGEKQTVSAREEILVTVGDAGAFAFTLNGREGKPLGGPGEVVSKRIAPANYSELVIP